MTGQTHRIGLEERGFNPANTSWVVVPDHERQQDAGRSSDSRPCMKCDCCKFWTGVVVQIADENTSAKDTIQKLHDNKTTLTDKNQQLTEENTSAKDTIQKLQASESTLKSDKEQLTKANKRLNAENNNIKTASGKNRTVPDKERTSTGKVGRPRGSKPTKNVRPKRIDRKETVDVTKCSKKHNLSDKVKSYTKVVKVLHVWVENVEYTINRRWCKKCDKYISAEPPGVPKHARVSDNYSALATHVGLSHANYPRCDLPSAL